MKKTLFLFLLLVALGLASCQPSATQPSTLFFTTKWALTGLSAVQQNALIQAVAADADLEPSGPSSNPVIPPWGVLRSCLFANDYTVGTPLNNPPVFRIAGAPADPTFTLRFSSIHLAAATNQVPTSCVPGTNDIPTDIVIVKSRQGSVVVGQVVPDVDITVTFGNDTFTSDYSEFTLVTLDSAAHTATGTFKMVGTNHGNSQDHKVLVIDGGFLSAHYF